jgi:hypothetical protein
MARQPAPLRVPALPLIFGWEILIVASFPVALMAKFSASNQMLASATLHRPSLSRELARLAIP